MTHNELWDGIKNLAEAHDVSCSRLAKLSGLDPTAFNKSKRSNKFGNRWLSTQSLARVLDCTGMTLAEFASFMPSDTHIRPRNPFLPPKHQRD